MKLTILLPSRTVVDREVAKVVAEAPNGFFLPAAAARRLHHGDRPGNRCFYHA